MAKHIVLVHPHGEGSTYYVTQKLWQGLVREGYRANIISYGSWLVPRLILRDVENLRALRKNDAIIYTGSVVFISPYFINKPRFLFVHGYNLSDFLYGRKELFSKLLGASYLASYILAKEVNIIDKYICHSITSCEYNKIEHDKRILLPQFVFRDEIIEYQRYRKHTYIRNNARRTHRVITYISSAYNSHRLLRPLHIAYILRQVVKQLNNCIELIIVTPQYNFSLKSSCLFVRTLKPMKREPFLKLLASSDLYIERNLDEELGLVTLEAGLVGTPVAKITLPNYVDRQDYTEDEILLGTSIRDLVDSLVNYFKNIDETRNEYAKKLSNFILTKREWNNVKQELVKEINKA